MRIEYFEDEDTLSISFGERPTGNCSDRELQEGVTAWFLPDDSLTSVQLSGALKKMKAMGGIDIPSLSLTYERPNIHKIES